MPQPPQPPQLSQQVKNKTSYIVCKYLGKLIHFNKQFELSELDRVELLMDLEETYNIHIDQKQFDTCNTIQKIETLLLSCKKEEGVRS